MLEKWLSEYGWSKNPFTFGIWPELFVGYQSQAENLISAIKSRHRLVLLVGPTGSGKTTLLCWLENKMKNSGFDILYVPKPPASPEELLQIFVEKYKPFLPFFKPKNIHQLPSWLSKRARNLVFLVDEAHEAPISVYAWLRVLSDSVDCTIVLSGLPILEDILRTKLESLRKRVAVKIELVSLSKEATIEMIKARAARAGNPELPFTQEMLDWIYSRSGGFPREILRLCNDLIISASQKGTKTITQEVLEKQESVPDLSNLPIRQRQILEMLIKPSTPTEIASSISGYSSHAGAVRSINNILKRLVEAGFVERTKTGRSYTYTLSPKLKTIFVKA